MKNETVGLNLSPFTWSFVRLCVFFMSSTALSVFVEARANIRGIQGQMKRMRHSGSVSNDCMMSVLLSDG